LDDGDQDGLTDSNEAALGTNPDIADTDGDGLADGAEVHTHGTNPLVFDTDGDGFGDGDEVAAGSDPLNPASFPHSVPVVGPLALGALAALLLASGALARRGDRRCA
ncbi:MAG TPA: MarR family transcriptional regulator, partial [Myxococcota bacterium]|nr:MarR family transcriptional regulator [Myxococcota bacterium]